MDLIIGVMLFLDKVKHHTIIEILDFLVNIFSEDLNFPVLKVTMGLITDHTIG